MIQEGTKGRSQKVPDYHVWDDIVNTRKLGLKTEDGLLQFLCLTTWTKVSVLQECLNENLHYKNISLICIKS